MVRKDIKVMVEQRGKGCDVDRICEFQTASELLRAGNHINLTHQVCSTNATHNTGEIIIIIIIIQYNHMSHMS